MRKATFQPDGSAAVNLGEEAMRGKIIHYNGNDGRGLVAADTRQIPFEIGQWRSDTAPSLNQIVDLVMEGDGLGSLAKVPDDVLLKEKAGQLAGKLGAAGGAALQSFMESNPPGIAGAAGDWKSRLGIPLLGAYAVFAISAMALSYLTVEAMFGPKTGYSLVSLSRISSAMGVSVGSGFWTWIAIFSVALPLFWKSRWAWLALLLPLLATVKPFIDIMMAAQEAAKGMKDMFGPQAGAQITKNMLDMFDTGMGFWVCLLSALVIAAFGLKRVLLPPN